VDAIALQGGTDNEDAVAGRPLRTRLWIRATSSRRGAARAFDRGPPFREDIAAADALGSDTFPRRAAHCGADAGGLPV